MQTPPPLVVFSHLRWDFVWQRPQHLMTRLASRRRVFFIEEPLHAEHEPHSWQIHKTDGVMVCRPRSPVGGHGFHDEQLPVLRPLLRGLFREYGVQDPVLWFYTPMALPLAEGIDSSAIVYDCVDELSAFKNPPPQMREREAELMRRADVVFTGGPSLYAARKERPPTSTASTAASMPPTSARPARRCRSRPTRRLCRTRGWASSASSTSASTGRCSTRWRRRGRTGASSWSARS